MTKKIAILTDSSSAIYSYPHQFNNLFMIDLPCFLGDEIYTDFTSNGNEKFFQALEVTNLVPKTSQPSVGEMLLMYEKIRDLGFSDIIVLAISRELSGTYQNAHLAKNIIKGVNVTIVDTLTTASILLELALVAADMANNNASIEEILYKIEEIKESWTYYLTVSDLTALVKNGRLSNAKSFIANIFHIKPVIYFNREGKLVALQNVRTFKKALRQVAELTLSNVKENSIIHLAYAKETLELEELFQYLKEKLPNHAIKKFLLPATIVAHVGLGAIGIGLINL